MVWLFSGLTTSSGGSTQRYAITSRIGHLHSARRDRVPENTGLGLLFDFLVVFLFQLLLIVAFILHCIAIACLFIEYKQFNKALPMNL